MNRRASAMRVLPAVGIVVALCMHTPPAIAQEPFWELPPSLDAGSYDFHYAGEVIWSEGDAVVRDTLEWTMRIDSMRQQGNIRAWAVTGYPLELAFYTPEKTPARYTLVEIGGTRFGGTRYYLCEKDALARLNDEADNLQGLVRESELILELPLHRGKQFGETAMLTRNDGMYCWYVEATRDTLVVTAGKSEMRQVYTAVYRTLGSLQLVEWMPGAGIIRYYYHHNGTRSDVDVRLTSVTKP